MYQIIKRFYKRKNLEQDINLASTVTVKLIVATDEKGGIGKDGYLPGFPKVDSRWFKMATKDKICLCTSNTYLHMRGLPNIPMILTREPDLYPGMIAADNALDLLNTALKYAVDNQHTEIIICGGPILYKALETYVDEFWVTVVDGDYKCDAFYHEALGLVKHYIKYGVRDLSKHKLADGVTLYRLGRYDYRTSGEYLLGC